MRVMFGAVLCLAWGSARAEVVVRPGVPFTAPELEAAIEAEARLVVPTSPASDVMIAAGTDLFDQLVDPIQDGEPVTAPRAAMIGGIGFAWTGAMR